MNHHTSDNLSTDIKHEDEGELNYMNKRFQQKKDANKRNLFCYGCGAKDHLFNDAQCRAVGKSCNFCKKRGHFESVCRSKRYSQSSGSSQQQTPRYNQGVNQLADTPQDHTIPSPKTEEEYLFSIVHNVNNSSTRSTKHNRATIAVDGCPISFIIDSGSTCNIIDRNTFESRFNGVRVHNTNTKIYTYGSSEALPLHGVFYPVLQNGNVKVISPVIIRESHNTGFTEGT